MADSVDVESVPSPAVPRVGALAFPPKSLYESLSLVPMGLDYPLTFKFKGFVQHSPDTAPRFQARVLYGRVEGHGHTPLVSISAEKGLQLGWLMPLFEDENSEIDVTMKI